MPDPTSPDSLESYIREQQTKNVEGSIADASKGFSVSLKEAALIHGDTEERVGALNTVIQNIGRDIDSLEGALARLIKEHGGSTDQLSGVASRVMEEFEGDISGHTFAARRELVSALTEALKTKGDEKLVPEKVLENFVQGSFKKDNITLKALGKLDGFAEGVTKWLTSGAAGTGDRSALEEQALDHLGALPEGVLNKNQREAFTKIGVEDRRRMVRVLFDTLGAARSLLLHRLLTNDAVDAYFGVVPKKSEMAEIFHDRTMGIVRAALNKGDGVEVTVDGHLVYLYTSAESFDQNLAKVESALSAGRHIVDVTLRPNAAPLFEKGKGLKGGSKLQARRVSDGKEIQVVITSDGAMSGGTLNTLGTSEGEFRADPRKFVYGFSDLEVAS